MVKKLKYLIQVIFNLFKKNLIVRNKKARLNFICFTLEKN